MKYGSIQFQIDLPLFQTGDMPEGTLHAILKQAGIEVDDFTKKK